MAKKRPRGLVYLNRPLPRLPSAARWQRLGCVVAARQRLTQRWLQVAARLGERYEAAWSDPQPQVTPPDWQQAQRLDLPLLLTWPWAGGGLPVRAVKASAPAPWRQPAITTAARRTTPTPSQAGRPQDVEAAHAPLAGQRAASGERRPLIQLRTILERSPYSLPDARLRRFLAGIVKLPLPAVRLFTGPDVDAVLQSFGAAALSADDAVLVRSAAYPPRSAAGLALLAHEMTHAAAAAQPALLQTAARGVADEERLAQESEHRVKRVLNAGQGDYDLPMPVMIHSAAGGEQAPVSRSTAGGMTRPGPAVRSPAPPAPPMTIRAAPAGRDLGEPPPDAESPPPAQLTAQQLRLIKDEVYRDLMSRLRVERERGG
jgi:hypothetical protein